MFEERDKTGRLEGEELKDEKNDRGLEILIIWVQKMGLLI